MIIYTDGAAKGNGKDSAKAGWGWVAYTSKGKQIAYDFGEVAGEQTNNRGELTALIEAYEWVKDAREKGYNDPVYIYSDSAYCVNGLNDWMHGWERNGWKRSGNKSVINLDMWKTLFELYHSIFGCGVKKVKGHSGDLGNEEADRLAGLGVGGGNQNGKATRSFSIRDI